VWPHLGKWLAACRPLQHAMRPHPHDCCNRKTTRCETGEPPDQILQALLLGKPGMLHEARLFTLIAFAFNRLLFTRCVRPCRAEANPGQLAAYTSHSSTGSCSQCARPYHGPPSCSWPHAVGHATSVASKQQWIRVTHDQGGGASACAALSSTQSTVDLGPRQQSPITRLMKSAGTSC